jgi:hypothetical protein
MSGHHDRATRATLDKVTLWLIDHAAQCAPRDVAARLNEEWLADACSRGSSWSRLCFAIDCWRAILSIVGDLRRQSIPAALTEFPTREYVTMPDRSFGYFSLGSATLFLIVGLHAALFGGLATTLPRVHDSVQHAHSAQHRANSHDFSSRFARGFGPA